MLGLRVARRGASFSDRTAPERRVPVRRGRSDGDRAEDFLRLEIELDDPRRVHHRHARDAISPRDDDGQHRAAGGNRAHLGAGGGIVDDRRLLARDEHRSPVNVSRYAKARR